MSEMTEEKEKGTQCFFCCEPLKPNEVSWKKEVNDPNHFVGILALCHSCDDHKNIQVYGTNNKTNKTEIK